MFECTLLYNTKFINELLTGFGDFISIIVLGILLGIFVSQNNNIKKEKQNILSIFIIAIFYIAGRYFAYIFLPIRSAYKNAPLQTFVWTLSIGLWIGIIYWLLIDSSKGKTPFTRTLFFVFIIFGLNWFIYSAFMLTIFAFTPEIFVRVGSDIVILLLGSLFCQYTFNKNLQKQ